LRKEQEEKKALDGMFIIVDKLNIAKVQQLSREILEKGNELNDIKSKFKAKKERCI
jgi:hypothetical protein